MSADESERGGDEEAGNSGDQFDRLPTTPAAREVPGRVARSEVLDYLEERFGIPAETFAHHTFWEKGAGKIWVVYGDHPSPIEVEGLGMTCLRTRQEFWKPTTDFVQRFGELATNCVVVLSGDEAARFLAGEEQAITWDGDWGYLIAARETAGDTVPLGVGLYTYGELNSMVPKGRQR
jgi:uracil-DNA glycosylase